MDCLDTIHESITTHQEPVNLFPGRRRYKRFRSYNKREDIILHGYGRNGYNPISDEIVLHFGSNNELPSFLSSSTKNAHIKSTRKLGGSIRCFYTGKIITPSILHQDYNIFKDPFGESRDHIIPISSIYRYVTENPLNDTSMFPKIVSELVIFSSGLANQCLNSAPMMIKLKVREWLGSLDYSKTCPDDIDGRKLYYAMVKLKDHFRLNGKYIWVPKHHVGRDLEISIAFLEKMYEYERKFIEMPFKDKNRFIHDFNWNY